MPRSAGQTEHMDPAIRSMADSDVEAADQVWREAFATSTEYPTAPRTDAERATDLARRRHFLATDPEGSFVATVGERVVGLAQSLLREGTFVLSMLAVDPAHQDRGIGGQLLGRVLEHATTATSASIFSSSDPRALHRYVRSGFTLNPAVTITPRSASGAEAPQGPDRIRLAHGDENDLDLLDEIDRSVRGSARRTDLAFLVSCGFSVLIDDAGGYAILGTNRLSMLVATEVSIAENLLEAVLGGWPDQTARSVGWVTAEQQWAIRKGAELGATIAVHGAVMTRRDGPPPSPALPNGLFA